MQLQGAIGEMIRPVQVGGGGVTVPILPDDKRLQLSLACQHLAIEHGQSIVVLFDDEIYGSALALLRPMFEALVRCVWLRYMASIYRYRRKNFRLYKH